MSAAAKPLPRLCAIVDVGCFEAHPHPPAAIAGFVAEMLDAGAIWLQYRDKKNSSRQALANAREIGRLNRGGALLVMNDRADLCLAAEFDGVHLGQDDLSLAAARDLLGAGKLIGGSTHTLEQVRALADSPADYIAIGPIFPTRSKQNPGPVVGLDLLHCARPLTSKPLVAIGGITRANCKSVIEAGADSVAVISDLLARPARAVEDFLRILE